MENIKEFILAQIDDLDEAISEGDNSHVLVELELQKGKWQEVLDLIDDYENSEPAWTDPTDMIAGALNSLAVLDNYTGTEENPANLSKEQAQLVDDIRGNALGLCSFATDKLWNEMKERLKWEKEQRQKKKAAKKEGGNE